MSEKAKEIKVKLQYIPEKDDDIEVEPLEFDLDFLQSYDE